LLHTTHGGLNWDIQFQVSNEGQYRNIAYQNEDTLIITTNEHLMYSYNGGESWEDIEDNLWQDLFSASFINRQRGWWAGEENQVHSTYYGGVTWDTSYVANNPNFEINRVRGAEFANDTLGWAFIRVSDPAVEGVYVSTDGGQHGQSKTHL
jgi:photosystem II stability/assembly factor-like uncharacterized protein